MKKRHNTEMESWNLMTYVKRKETLFKEVPHATKPGITQL